MASVAGLTTVWSNGAGGWRYSVPDSYAEMVREAGLEPLAVLPGAGPAVLDSLDLLVLIGGGDPDPALFGRPGTQVGPVELARPRWEIGLFRRSREAGLPVLGVCMGMQLMAISDGVGLIQHIPDGVEGALDHAGTLSRPVRHGLEACGDGPLARAIAGLEQVESYHHQAIDGVPDGWRLAARAPDGVAEAIEACRRPAAWGVQWHPERDGSWRVLLPALLEEGPRGSEGR
jgi:gamma-glutamyl-gamma-aminobutyrate hydrolase PuuD